MEQEGSLSSNIEHERNNDTQNERSLTPVNHHHHRFWVNFILDQHIRVYRSICSTHHN